MNSFREHITKICPLTDEEFEYVYSHFSIRKFKKHQFLVQDGNTVNNDHWVIEGLLKVYHIEPDGKEHILQFANEDWWATDYQAYFYKTPATLNITCLEDTQVLSLSLDNRDKICNEMHKMEHFFRLKSNAGYVALQKRILSLLCSSPKERYNQFLNQYPSLLHRLPKTLIASFLGVSRETLSRLNNSY